MEQLVGIIERLRLHVLRQAERDRARLGRRRQDAQRFRQRGDQLLGAVDAIPVFRDRPEAVVDRRVLRRRRLELLQHRRRPARREDVARQQQHRQTVDRGQRGAGNHVGRARADRTGARDRPPPVGHLGEADRRVHHRLLVPREVHGQPVSRLQERLADAGHVAVAENRRHAGEERLFHAVETRVLLGQEFDDRLPHREAPGGGHGALIMPPLKPDTLSTPP